MHRTRVKICGVTRPEDAALAAAAGADAIGIVFYPRARRCITTERAAKILRSLPAFVTPVGLFVDQPVDEVRRIAETLGLRHLQLHGHESPHLVASLQGFVVLKALRVDPSNVRAELATWRAAIRDEGLSHLRGIILETAAAGLGGTGVENDWALVATLQEEGAFHDLPPIVAAGGLRPENVGAVVRDIRPFAVDVSSGVEGEPNCKSAEKVHHFMRAVREADDAN